MPSHYTPNFNLSQWEKTDKVQMEDFNADNAKLDAALAGMLHPVTLHDLILEEATQQIEFDVMEEEWWKYSVIFLTITAGSTFCDSITFRTGYNDSQSKCQALNSSNSERQCLSFCASFWASTTIFFPGGSPKNVIQALTIENTFIFYGSGPTYQNGKTIRLISNDIPAGTHICIRAIL